MYKIRCPKVATEAKSSEKAMSCLLGFKRTSREHNFNGPHRTVLHQ